MLRSRVLRVIHGLMQKAQSVYKGDKSEAAEFKEWMCVYLNNKFQGCTQLVTSGNFSGVYFILGTASS